MRSLSTVLLALLSFCIQRNVESVLEVVCECDRSTYWMVNERRGDELMMYYGLCYNGMERAGGVGVWRSSKRMVDLYSTSSVISAENETSTQGD